MGTFSVDLWVGNLFVEAGATVSALVDTGSTHSMMPAGLLRELGIAPVVYVVRYSLRIVFSKAALQKRGSWNP